MAVNLAAAVARGCRRGARSKHPHGRALKRLSKERAVWEPQQAIRLPLRQKRTGGGDSGGGIRRWARCRIPVIRRLHCPRQGIAVPRPSCSRKCPDTDDRLRTREAGEKSVTVWVGRGNVSVVHEMLPEVMEDATDHATGHGNVVHRMASVLTTVDAYCSYVQITGGASLGKYMYLSTPRISHVLLLGCHQCTTRHLTRPTSVFPN